MLDIEKKLAVVVISCDNYSSLWDIFFSRFQKFWPDCPYEKYLVTNFKKFDYYGVNCVNVGEDRDWSSNLLNALTFIPETNLLLFLEDSPLNSVVNQSMFESVYEEFVSRDMDFLNLKNDPKFTSYFSGISRIPEKSFYRATVVINLWSKCVFQNLLKAGESAWEFEIAGTQRSDLYPNFYSLNRCFFDYIHIVYKRKIMYDTAKILKLSGELKILEFPVQNRCEYIKLKTKNFIRTFSLKIIPRKLQRMIRYKLKGKGFSYV
jgi:hypothetical protein